MPTLSCPNLSAHRSSIPTSKSPTTVSFSDIGFDLYSYNPNVGAPIALGAFFVITVFAHISQIVVYKCWKITGPLPWGGVLFIAGFVMREISIRDDQNFGIFIASQVLLMAAPPIYALTNYLFLGRTLFYVPYLSPIHPGRVISTFVGLDGVVEALTGTGAAKIANLSNSPSQHVIGVSLIRASLLLQVALFMGFTSIEVLFHIRCMNAGVMTRKLQTIIALLYTSSTLILIRNIYRAIEQWNGFNPGYLQLHEAFFYIFDAALMLVNSVVLNVWHPAKYLPRNNKICLKKDGVTEVEGPRWDDARPWWISALDPFDLVGLVSGRDQKTRFWEEGSFETESKNQD